MKKGDKTREKTYKNAKVKRHRNYGNLKRKRQRKRTQEASKRGETN